MPTTAPEEKRDYNMGDSDLAQVGDNMVNLAARDATDLQTRGFNAARLTSLKNARDTFNNLPTDVELLADVSVAAQAKDAARDVLEGAIQSIRGMAENKWGPTGYYKKFGFEGLTNLTDEKLIRCGRRVARVGTTLLSQLASEGLTAALLTTLNANVLSFDNALDAVDTAEETRDISTQDRIEAGNKLYAQIMQVANAGQNVYRTTNEAKFNDYIVNDAPPPPAAVQTP